MNMKKIYILICLVVILAAILISGCMQQPQRKIQVETDLEFSLIQECIPIDVISQYKDKLRVVNNTGDQFAIKEINWLDNATLQINTYLIINCAEKIEYGDYKRINDTVILKYNSPACNGKNPCMDCICAHELLYKFTNLEKRDYQFELERIY